MPDYKLQKDGSFLIKDYNQASPFSNFLPGIAGAWGIPLWAFYQNRGQALSGFGLKDKDGAIAEFYPANKAYSLTPFFGFRTFIKDNQGCFYEPFAVEKSNSQITQSMRIASSDLEITDKNPAFGLVTAVKYFNLVEEPVASLVRKVTFKNTSGKVLKLKILDGLARVIPYGTANSFLKEMSRTVEAWMHSSLENNSALFRLIVDPADVAHTTYIEGANFNYSFYRQNQKKVHPPLLVDPERIFGKNLSYTYPQEFLKKNFNPNGSQILCGKTPSAFSYLDLKLEPEQAVTFYSLFGGASQIDSIEAISQKADACFLANKEIKNKEIIDQIKDNAFCLSGSEKLNHYLSSSYLDNILRGGFPYRPDLDLVDCLPYYIYSRKHGDPERDYNYFNLSPSFFSEGQGNYRDVNQNRRMDLFFQPSLEEENITYFLNLIQIDGYNPLVVKGQKLYLRPVWAEKLAKKYQIKKKKILHLMVKGFYLGELLGLLAAEKKLEGSQELVSFILKKAQRETESSHREGYWIDHWRYGLDLIENYLNIYPDRLAQLFLATEFTFFDDKFKVKPRQKRYVLRRGRVYQGESIQSDKDKARILKNRKKFENLLRADNNKVYKTNLIEKLLVLILNKAASFDPDGLGIEMEADKPGWCDSLNGLPALFGSSLCETFELKRAALILKDALTKLEKNSGLKTVKLSKTIYNFFNSLDKTLKTSLRSNLNNKDFIYWDNSNKLKENFRRNAFFSVSSQKNDIRITRLENFLDALIKKINNSRRKAKDKKSKLYLTYFTYSVVEFKKTNHHPQPLKFKRHNLPLFLEGVVSGLRLEKKKSIYANTKKSSLYDSKLKMYKLNASLAGEPLDIGRSRVFTPGWLENESVWLHMEYKYLLELLKAGLYKEFFSEFKNCAICFQSPKVYGRSILENSSFIVSSCHPDKNLHGKGLVARLTGATAELVNIWILISLGAKPFFLDRADKLVFAPRPVLEAGLFTKKSHTLNWQAKKIKIPKNTYSFKLFSQTLVVYHNPRRLDTFAKNCRVKKIVVKFPDKTITAKAKLSQKPAQLIRAQKALRIDIYLG